MRGKLAAALLLAHCAGLLVMAIFVTFMSSEPAIGAVGSTFLLGLMFSADLFLPLVVVASLFAGAVVRHRLAFVLLGPLMVTALWSATSWPTTWDAVAISTGFSSLVMFALLRSKSFACGSASQPQSTT